MSTKTTKNTAFKQTKLTAWRILEIDSYIQTGKSYTAVQLASLIGTHDKDKNEYSSRTIQRDLEYMLDTLHAPIESDYRGYRYTEPNFFIKSIPLTGIFFYNFFIRDSLKRFRKFFYANVIY